MPFVFAERGKSGVPTDPEFSLIARAPLKEMARLSGYAFRVRQNLLIEIASLYLSLSTYFTQLYGLEYGESYYNYIISNMGKVNGFSQPYFCPYSTFKI